MRELKFRGWSEDYKVMTYPFTLEDVDKNRVGVEGTSDERDFANYPLAELFVMQWTGLQDKNGKDIYDGDIVRHFTGFGMKEHIDSVHWQDDQWRVGSWQPDGLAGFTCEIMGNIWQNPELLKATQ